jgi:hypothetical protein
LYFIRLLEEFVNENVYLLVRDNMTFLTGMKKGHTKFNATIDKFVEGLYSSTIEGQCFALLNGNHTSAACNESFGFLCEQAYVF